MTVLHGENKLLADDGRNTDAFLVSKEQGTWSSLRTSGDALAIPPHPLGIQPLGNAYAAKTNLKWATGEFSQLPDEILIQILEHLDAPSLISLGTSCRAFYAFSRLDELWKNFCVESPYPISSWRGTWYATFRGIEKAGLAIVSCRGLYSDVLHRPFVCAHTALTPYCGNVPKSNAIPKLSNIDPVEFTTNWTDKPFILTEPVRKWPVFSRWSEANMLAKYGDVMFRAEAVDWPLKTYVDYMSDNQDESPLYLFDRNFVEKMDLAVGTINESEYWPPECFGEDLFSVFSHERPDCRWLIVGPERSGSTFHKDPNATSAWNAVLGGSKYWIMFPSGHGVPPPPGVFVSEDQSEVTSPLSIAEWLISFHGEARKTPGCKEAVCNEGEVLHVPSGWWHLVINLSPSIAITQNFVPERQLVNVLDFLKNKSDQVSGFKDSVQDPYQLFVEKLGEQKPQTLESAMDVLAYLSRPKKRKWDMVVQEGKNGDEGRNEGFSFGFGDQDDVDVP